MAKHPRLHRRPNSKSYYFRAKIPTDLLDQYGGRKEVCFSLRTSDYREALKRVRVESVKLDQEFDEKRRSKAAEGAQVAPPVADSISPLELARLIALFKHSVLQSDEEGRYAGLGDWEFDRYGTWLEGRENELRLGLARGNISVIEDVFQDWLQGHGVSLSPDADRYRPAALAFLKAAVEVVEAQQRRHAGYIVETPAIPSSPAQTGSNVFHAPSPLQSANMPSISQVFERWANEHLIEGGPQGTVDDFGVQIRRFTELIGDLPVNMITAAHIRDFKDAMLQFPAMSRGRVFQGLTTSQILARIKELPDSADIKRLSPRTVNDKVLAAVGAVLAWAKSNAYIEFNPTSGIKVKSRKVHADQRLPYSVDDLNVIFRFPIFTVHERPQGGGGEAAKWLPLLALFTGARLEELGQLTSDDIQEERGVTFFDLTSTEEGKSRKTESSKRRVPVHPELVRLGFLKYAEAVGEGHLFLDLAFYRGKRTVLWSKWWGKYARDNGITDRRKVFHSFRHCAKLAMREGGVEEQVSDAITGHAPRTEGRKYGGDLYPIAQLADGIKRLVYPGLDLSHLLPGFGG